MWSMSSVATAPGSNRDTLAPRSAASWRSDSLKALLGAGDSDLLLTHAGQAISTATLGGDWCKATGG